VSAGTLGVTLLPIRAIVMDRSTMFANVIQPAVVRPFLAPLPAGEQAVALATEFAAIIREFQANDLNSAQLDALVDMVDGLVEELQASADAIQRALGLPQN
jgi:hypothetical protein